MNKPIAIVAKKGCAITMNYKKQYASIHAKDNMTASLMALKAVLNKIPTNDMLLEEPRLILLWSKSPIVGFATGTYIEYLRTNQTASGIPFTTEEMTLIRECALLLAERNLNVSICTYVFASNNNYRNIIDAAWNAVNYCISTQGYNDMPQNDVQTIEHSHDDTNEAYRESESVDNKAQRLKHLLDRRRKIKNNSFCEDSGSIITDFSPVENKITAIEKTKNKNFVKSENKNFVSNSSIFLESNCISPGPFSSWQLLMETNRDAKHEVSGNIAKEISKMNYPTRAYDSRREAVD
jgi:hypothetical protein